MNISFDRCVSPIGIVLLTIIFTAKPCDAASFPDALDGAELDQLRGGRYAHAYALPEKRDTVTLREYESVREQSGDMLADHLRLARWCQTHGLSDRRDAHLHRALMHDPENRHVRKLLRHVNVDGQWYTPEQVENHTNQVEAARRRLKDWREPVKKISRQLRSRSGRMRELGMQQLDNISDPRCVTALEMILTDNSEPIGRQAIETINRFPEREATQSLARIALLSRYDQVREASLDMLAKRNRYDFVPDLIGQLVSPVSTRHLVRPDANGSVLYQYVLFQQHLEKDLVRDFQLRLVQSPVNANFAWQSRMIGEANRRAAVADNGIRRLNASIHRQNTEIQYLLARTTDASPGDAPADWWRWWYDENEIYAAERPVSYTRIEQTEVTASPQIQMAGECLVAGTPIVSELGLRPVESLQVGDRVLSQDPESGRLEYRAVLYPTTRPATPTFQIRLRDETIRASGGHLFQVVDRGWTKTRHLNAGMILHSARGTGHRVMEIRSAETVPLYNLVVDENANYFVGNSQILSHDSTILSRGAPSVEQFTE